jgi:hypothetical protein
MGWVRRVWAQKYHQSQHAVAIMRPNPILFKSLVFVGLVCADWRFDGSVYSVLNQQIKNYLKNKIKKT